MDIKRVGILRGGMGDEYHSSLRHGGDIIMHINENLADKYKTFDILIDRDGAWHLNGMPVRLDDLIHKVDIIWNTSHPSIATHLDNLSIPNVGASAFSHAVLGSKEMLREHMKKVGVEMPRSIVIPLYQKDFDGPRERYSIKKAKQVHEKFGAPWIVKSFTPDSSMGIHLAKTFDELVGAIEDGVNHNKSILVEEFVTGKIASVHSVQNFRNEEVYNFPLGNTYGKFTHEEREQLYSLVGQIRSHVGASHYLKSDFVFHPRGKVYLLGITSTPNLKPASHFAEVCDLVGAKTHHIVDHILGNIR